jgi:hypothetical protein
VLTAFAADKTFDLKLANSANDFYIYPLLVRKTGRALDLGAA